MAECIEREATIKRIKEVYCVGCNSYNGVRCRACGTGDAIDIIEDAPAADVAPVVHGRWEMRPTGMVTDTGPEYKAYCTICNEPNKQYQPPFCPHCGAKMDGERKDGKDG